MSLDYQAQEAQNEVGAIWRWGEDTNKLVTTMDGGMRLAPFQCIEGWFQNPQKRSPVRGSREGNSLLLGYIRGFNLEVMWSRELGNVASNTKYFNPNK